MPWENGCPCLDERILVDTCSAAENGHLECLKYAHENGCPWDEQLLVLALPKMVTSSV